MATLSNAAAKAACDAIVDLVDAGSGALRGVYFRTSAPAEVANCLFSDTAAFGAATTASPAVATAGTIADDTSASAGTINGADGVQIRDKDGTVIITCSIATTSSADFQIGGLTIGEGDTVGVSALTVSMPTT